MRHCSWRPATWRNDSRVSAPQAWVGESGGYTCRMPELDRPTRPVPAPLPATLSGANADVYFLRTQAVLRHADYTRKTQELADQRSALKKLYEHWEEAVELN